MAILTVLAVPGAVWRETIRVAKRVQQSLPTGKGMPVKFWSRDDFPEDWQPTTTI